MKKNMKLKGLSLIDVVITMGIIGLLASIAVVGFSGLFSKAQATEAEQNLSHMKNMEEAYKLRHFEYTKDLKAISFVAPEQEKDGGTSMFEYEVESASNTAFVGKATAVKDFDGDGQIMVMTINEKGKIETTVED